MKKPFSNIFGHINAYSLALTILGALATFSGLIYRLYKLNTTGIAMTLAFLAIFFIILGYFGQKFKPTLEPTLTSQKAGAKPIFFISCLYILLVAFSLFFMWRHGTDRSIISPWEVVPLSQVMLYGLASLLLLIILSKGSRYPKTLIGFHYFYSFSLLALVYRLGYGYDFFIHQATLELINKTGVVLPKTNYYLGHYGLIIVLHKLFGIPLALLNRWLVPLLASLLLPSCFYLWQKNLKLEGNPHSVSLLLLLLTFSFLTFSTPQNLAYLFLILTLGALSRGLAKDLVPASLLAAAALITQPIAGLAAVLAVVWQFFRLRDLKQPRLWKTVLFLFACLALPLAFSRLSVIHLQSLQLGRPEWLPQSFLSLPNAELVGWNFLYFFGQNLYWMIAALLITGLYISIKRVLIKNIEANLALGSAFLLGHALTKLLPFDFLIGYERDDYADRLLVVAFILLLPLLLITFNALLNNIAKKKILIRAIWFVFLSAWLGAAFYLSYPRFDRYYNSRGYSVGHNDIEAVRWIDHDAHNSYAVLANQQVSAAALHEFGFAHYYNNLFYYPVPTASPLYQKYLDMVYKTPSRETAEAAATLTGVDTIYFALNKYWYAYAKILAEAKLSADSFQTFDNGEIIVFKYVIKK
ncbi:hypothetical protein HGA64_04910 [Candidatus Falkowbacteria bacterium]|nr:hypothetical protein [Candidatus Falkowbacteria bacterium]